MENKHHPLQITVSRDGKKVEAILSKNDDVDLALTAFIKLLKDVGLDINEREMLASLLSIKK